MDNCRSDSGLICKSCFCMRTIRIEINLQMIIKQDWGLTSSMLWFFEDYLFSKSLTDSGNLKKHNKASC